MNTPSTANDNCHYARITTPALTKSDAKRRDAARLAGTFIITASLRGWASYRLAHDQSLDVEREMSARDAIIGALGKYAAESLYGFHVDFDTLIRDELVQTYQRARQLQRRRSGLSTRGLHTRTTEYLRRLCKQAERYLARPEVKAVLDELVHEASLKRSLPGLVQRERWQHRRLQVPIFDAVVARALERERQRMLESTLSLLADLKSEARAA